MLSIILFYASLIVTVILLPFFAYLAIITAAALGYRKPRKSKEVLPVRFQIVIPAHDEENNIQSTVESCQTIHYEKAFYKVYVIADNCTDATARLARSAGAEVVVRTDPERRSKGHALEYFFRQQSEGDDLFDAVVLVDADTTVDPGILTAFAKELAEGKDWIQCYYTVRNPDATWRTRLMTYTLSLFNGVWLLGQDRLGLGVGLKGNGMCFSARGLTRFPWKAHGLTEDLEFSWMLRVAGEKTHFIQETRVSGTMPTRGGTAAMTQRRRWESGRKALRGRFFGQLIGSRRIGLPTKFMYLLDLLFPPLVTLLLGLLGASLLRVGVSFETRLSFPGRWLLPVHTAMALILACYALSPCLVLNLPIRYLGSVVALPYYAVWKLLVTTGRMPTSWVRTPREPAPDEVMS